MVLELKLRKQTPYFVTGEYIHMALCMVPKCVTLMEVVMRTLTEHLVLSIQLSTLNVS